MDHIEAILLGHCGIIVQVILSLVHLLALGISHLALTSSRNRPAMIDHSLNDTTATMASLSLQDTGNELEDDLHPSGWMQGFNVHPQV